MSKYANDFRDRVQRSTKTLRAACDHQYVTSARTGVERCSLCGDCFPCKGDRCEHVDCIEQSIKLRRRPGFPANFSFPVTSLNKGHTSLEPCDGCRTAPDDHYWLVVDPREDPSEWILPDGWTVDHG